MDQCSHHPDMPGVVRHDVSKGIAIKSTPFGDNSEHIIEDDSVAFCATVAGLANPRLFQPRQRMLCHYSACSIPVVGSAPLQRSGLLQQGFLRVDLHSAPSTALGRNALGLQWTYPTSRSVELESLQSVGATGAISPLSGRHDGAGNLSRRTGATARSRVEVKVILGEVFPVGLARHSGHQPPSCVGEGLCYRRY